MKLNILVNRDEYIRSYRKYLFYSSMPIKIAMAALLSFALLGVIFFKMFDIDFFTNIYVFFVVLLVLILVYMLYLVPLTRYRKNKTNCNTYVMSITDDSITVSTCHTRSEYKWDTVKELYEDSEFYYVVLILNKIEIVPKRTFANSEKEEEFKEIFQRKNKIIYLI